MIVCADLSLGANGFLHSPVSALLSPYQGLRAPGRMFVMVSACLAVLAAHGVGALLRTRRRGQLALAATLSAAVIVEGLAVPLPLTQLPRGPRPTPSASLANPITCSSQPATGRRW